MINGLHYAITTRHEPSVTDNLTSLEQDVRKTLTSELHVLGLADYYHAQWKHNVELKTHKGDVKPGDDDCPTRKSALGLGERGKLPAHTYW